MDSDRLDGQVNIRLLLKLKRALISKSRASGVPISALARRAFEMWVGGEWDPFVQSRNDCDDNTERKAQ